jgi:hypothetical protein
MLGISVLGALVAGTYGSIHDQVTFSLSPEYFTKLKCVQFRYADLGFPMRVFVGEIGFLATWWVGFVSGWFLARLTIPRRPPVEAFRRSLAGMLWVVGGALAGGMVGYLLGIRQGMDPAGWADIGMELGIEDLRAFVRVAYIHNAGYLGGLIGLVLSLVWTGRSMRAACGVVA